METSFKNWLCPNFLSLPKKSELPKLWGGCSPPRPPGPYAYVLLSVTSQLHDEVFNVTIQVSIEFFLL